MIDLHCHILPGIDDGPEDLAETLGMCVVAAQDGICEVVATPHACDGHYDAPAERVIDEVAALNRKLATRGIPLIVRPGMEIRIVPELPELIATGEALTLNFGRYALVEFHPAHVPAGFDILLKRLSADGYGVILGHPERNLAVQQNPEYVFRLLREFAGRQLLIQISAGSLVGAAGPHALRAARALLKNRLAHLIASDAHSPFLRSPRLSEAVIVAASLVGEERAMQMVWDIPRAVLHGRAFPDLGTPRNPRRWPARLPGISRVGRGLNRRRSR